MFSIPQLPLETYLLLLKSFTLFCFLAAFLILFKTIFVKRLEKLAKKTKNRVDDLLVEIIDRISWVTYIGVSIYLALLPANLSGLPNKIVTISFLIIITFQVIKSANVVINKSSEHFIKNHRNKHPDDDVSLIEFLTKLATFGLWILGLLLILSNLGYNITSLIAGLGIGGIAIALAVQNILSDIFSSFSIYLDKPFQVGDFIEVDQYKGVVKHIGIKTTRLETVRGEELVVPNKVLIESQIQNYKKMEHRRTIFKLYINQKGTSMKKIEIIPDMIKAVLEAAEHANIERVHLKGIEGNSILYETSYIVNSSDHEVYLDTQQEINLGILALFKKHKIQFYDNLDFIEK